MKGNLNAPEPERINRMLERMTLRQKRVLIFRLRYLLLFDKLSKFASSIPRFIITPSGVRPDRRKTVRRYHFVRERRFIDYLVDLLRTEP